MPGSNLLPQADRAGGTPCWPNIPCLNETLGKRNPITAGSENLPQPSQRRASTKHLTSFLKWIAGIAR